MRKRGRALRRLGIGGLVMLVAGSAWIVHVGTAIAAPPDSPQSRDSIWIDGDSQFNPANGVRKGRGTKQNPFVISGWQVDTVYIKDTSAHLILRNNVIERLHLNWNGGHVKLLGNTIGDLRVNENIERTGAPTSGRIARNTFDVVGQLRHFDGVFEDNVVGAPATASIPFVNDRAVNFDGFNGARFRDNTIYGYMDVRLHGHHHSSSFKGNSHMHSVPEGHEHHMKYMKVDHTRRFHRVLVANNRIFSAGPWALRYVDSGHSANDRTAASEDNEALNRPHRHFTRVLFKRNKLVGSGLDVEVFNSDDELHKKMGYGTLRLIRNNIKLTRDADESFSSTNGINVSTAQNLTLHIAGNQIGWAGDSERLTEFFGSAAGIDLRGFDHGRIRVHNNRMAHFEYGVYASEFSKSVHWSVTRLRASDVAQPVYYDNSVANHPRRG